MLPLLLAVAFTASNSFADDETDCGRERCERARGRAAAPSAATGPSFAAFEFAPASGTGMGTACACTSPTGAKGEPLTFTRTSSATCLKGPLLTGIANGDMVTCSSGQPRVMPGGMAWLGLEIEGSRTNLILQSQAFENAAWADETSGAAAITVTANAAVAPDGTMTARRFQIPAVSGGQFTTRSQSVSGNLIGFVFLRGNGSSGTFDVLIAGGTGPCVSCPYDSGSWTICNTATQGASNSKLYLGSVCSSPQASKDVFVWGAQVESAPFPSSYIATTTASVTRAAELATFSFAKTNATNSFAASAITPYALTDTDHSFVAISSAGPSEQSILDFRSAISQVTEYMTSCPCPTVNGGNNVLTENRVYGWWDGSNAVVNFNTSTTAPAAYGSTLPTTLIEIGSYSGAAQMYGVVSKVCVDPDPTRCR